MKFVDDRPYAGSQTAARKPSPRWSSPRTGCFRAYICTTNAAFLRPVAVSPNMRPVATMLSPGAGSNSTGGGDLFFYRRLKFSVFASRIRLGRWLHTVLNCDSSQHHWVSDSI
jgi:hypothetical protein